MKKKTLNACLVALIMLLQIPAVFAQHNETNSWVQFRGINRNGVSSDITIPDKMPKLVWKKEIGMGFSEVTISNNRLYTMLGERNDSVSGSTFVAAFDAKNGSEIWRTKIDSTFFDVDGFGDGPRSTPAIGKDYIFSFTSHGKLTANALKDGKTIWQVDFVKEFGSTRPRWGFSASPVLVDGVLIMEAGGTDSRAFIAFDIKSGNVLWTKGNGNAGYNSPLVAEIEGKTNIIFANGRTLYSLTSKGDTLWTWAIPVGGPMAMPVVYDNNKIFISTLRGGFVTAEIKNNTVTQLKTGPTMKNDYSSSLFYKGHIYGFNVASLQCISPETGKKMWTKRGFGKGSLIRVDDKLIVLSDKGKLAVVKAVPDAYNEIGRVQAIKGKSWTAPSFAGKHVFVRNLTEMACYVFN